MLFRILDCIFRTIRVCQIVDLVRGSFQHPFEREFLLLCILKVVAKCALFLVHALSIKNFV